MKKYLSLLISLLLFATVIIFLLVFSLGLTDGHFLYTLDDPYIHMAIAKNFVTSGTWGVTQYEFSSCSSSPLWTFLISFFYSIFGTKVIIPFILNILFASLTAFIIYGLIGEFTKSIFIQTVILLAILFFGPFVSVVFTGLEHSMYTFFIVLIIYYLFRIFDEQSSKKDTIVLFVLLVMLSLSRYEGMFIAAGLFLIFLYRKKVYTALGVLFSAFLPILVTGLISISKGWYFFPNSVILKSPVSLNDFGSFLRSIYNPNFFDVLWSYKRILLLLVVSGVMFFLNRKEEKSFWLKSVIFIFVFVTIMQIMYAKLGSLLRYEMYIIVFGILINSISLIIYLKDKKKNIKVPVIIFLCLLFIPFSISTIKAVSEVPIAMTNIYQMQYQMSKFINKYYNKKTIALNDIGAVNYYCDIGCVDLWGLADREVAELRRTGRYNTEEINRINRERKTEIVIIFDSWFEQYGGMPKSWYNSGIWRIQDNITCGSDVITFYATDSTAFRKLDENLWEFQYELPETVRQNGVFILRHLSF